MLFGSVLRATAVRIQAKYEVVNRRSEIGMLGLLAVTAVVIAVESS